MRRSKVKSVKEEIKTIEHVTEGKVRGRQKHQNVVLDLEKDDESSLNKNKRNRSSHYEKILNKLSTTIGDSEVRKSKLQQEKSKKQAMHKDHKHQPFIKHERI